MQHGNEKRLEIINRDLHELETRHDNIQLKIDSLEKTKLEINESMKTEQANNVMNAIHQAGKSPQDVIDMLAQS